MPNGVSRAVIEVLLDRVGQGAITLSPEGELTYLNQRFASMVGLNRGQLLGRPLIDFAAYPDRELLAATIENARDTAAQCRISLARQNGQGELQAVLTFAPLGHGQLSCIVTAAAGSGPQP